MQILRSCCNIFVCIDQIGGQCINRRLFVAPLQRFKDKAIFFRQNRCPVKGVMAISGKAELSLRKHRFMRVVAQAVGKYSSKSRYALFASVIESRAPHQVNIIPGYCSCRYFVRLSHRSLSNSKYLSSFMKATTLLSKVSTIPVFLFARRCFLISYLIFALSALPSFYGASEQNMPGEGRGTFAPVSV